MSRFEWLQVFETPADMWGLAVYLLVFPIYHAIYPILLMRFFPNRASRTKFDDFRGSWIEGILERKDYLLAAQQTRNLTMVNTLLASSSLLLMGFTASALMELSRSAPDTALTETWQSAPDSEGAKLLLLLMVFGVAFAYCMTSLRHLGHFTLVVGADPEMIEEYEGSAVDYLSNLINRASNRHTLAVRCLYSATPLFLWLFDTRLFIAVTILWGLKFTVLQDFQNRRKPATD